jgi:hypothetical protein
MCDLQGFLCVPVCSHEAGRKNQVIAIVGFEFQGFAHIVIGLLRISLGVPVHGKVAIGESNGESFNRALHQRQPFFELTLVNRHLAQSM